MSTFMRSTVASDFPAAPEDVLVTSAVVRRRYGQISDMTLWRWLRDPVVGFPQPLVIQRRRYWRVADLTAWEVGRARASG